MLELHPEQAANTLETLAPSETAVLLGSLPVPVAAKILEKVAPSYGAQCISQMELEPATRLLEKSRSRTGISLLRLMPVNRITNLLGQLSEKKTAVLKSQLSYPADLVGAWIDRESPVLKEHFSVQEARNFLRNSGLNIDHSICVLTENGLVAGMIELYQLAIAKNKGALSRILTTVETPLSDRTPLKSIQALTDWKKLDALPVTGAEGEFLGILTKRAFEQGLSQRDESAHLRETDSVIVKIVEGYTTAVTGMVHSVLSATSSENVQDT